MSDSAQNEDIEIIHSAYAERLRDAFKIFAENLAVGQGEKSCIDRFHRTLLLIRKARDLALQAASGVETVEFVAPHENGEHGESAAEAAGMATRKSSGIAALDALSADDQRMIEQALSGTHGTERPVRK